MIINNYTDIHSHIIPGVDDGSPSINVSLSILKIAYEEEGIRTIIATPHYGIENGYKPSKTAVQEGYKILCDEAIKEYPDLRILLGYELYFSEEHLRARAIGRSMAGSDYLLVEFLEYGDEHEGADHIIKCLKALAKEKAYRPILAHAERYRDLRKNRAVYKELVENGVYLQINAYDIFENSSEGTRSTTQWIVKEQLAHFLGTDTHSHRPPRMKSGIEYLYKNCAEQYADALVFGNADKLLKNEVVDL